MFALCSGGAPRIVTGVWGTFRFGGVLVAWSLWWLGVGFSRAPDEQFAVGALSFFWVVGLVGERWRRRSRLDLSIGHNPPQTVETCLESNCASSFSGKREQGHHLTRYYRRDQRDACLNPLRSEKAKPAQSSKNWAGLWRSINLTLIERMPTLYLGACGLATAHG